MVKKSGIVKAVAVAEACIEIVEGRKADNVVKIQVAKLSVLADYFVICTANSEPHLRAVESHLRREILNRFKIKPRAVDGIPSSHWMVMDYGSVVVHLLTEEMREIYQLEQLWENAPTLEELETIASRSPAVGQN